jgi:hypothetical protein
VVGMELGFTLCAEAERSAALWASGPPARRF